MSLAGSQQKIFLRLLAALRPHWRRDAHLPARIQALFAANRAFGSRDRRLYRELIYTTLRFLPWVEPLLDREPARATQVVAWLAADLPATHAFRAAHCGDWPPCPPSVAAKAAHIGADPAALFPAWLSRHCPEAFVAPNLDALNTRAPLWLRRQASDDVTALAEFSAQGWAWRRAEILPTAIQVLTEADVTKTQAWRNGLIEVQDLGSQLILESIGITAGGHWLDACAGAGGKTLQLAQLLGPTGKVDAHDVRPAALQELGIRAARAGLGHLLGDKPASHSGDLRSTRHAIDDIPGGKIVVLSAPPTLTYDGVLVDAPCSGSGTWRRSPHLKWTTSAGQVTQAAEKQLGLLKEFSSRVRPGGQLVYATCSLSRFENEAVVTTFLQENPAFSALPFANTFGFSPRENGMAILPARHDTDGFFVASLRRR